MEAALIFSLADTKTGRYFLSAVTLLIGFGMLVELRRRVEAAGTTATFGPK